MLKQVCGLTVPDPIRSSSNVIYVSITFDTARRGSKFLAKWVQIDNSVVATAKPYTQGCGSTQVIDMSTVVAYNLTSPGYPNGEPQLSHCEWIFSTSPGYHLGMYINSVELSNEFNIYSWAVINVFSRTAETEDWKLILQLTPHNTTRPTIYASNMMKVIFTNNYIRNGTGFSASVERGKKQACNSASRLEYLCKSTVLLYYL